MKATRVALSVTKVGGMIGMPVQGIEGVYELRLAIRGDAIC